MPQAASPLGQEHTAASWGQERLVVSLWGHRSGICSDGRLTQQRVDQPDTIPSHYPGTTQKKGPFVPRKIADNSNDVVASAFKTRATKANNTLRRWSKWLQCPHARGIVLGSK
eukprot:6461313-Amphidinium_carterae.2